MTGQERFVEERGPVRHVEDDDGTVSLVADVGAGHEASVDVVGETAIVVADGEQYEFEVPADGGAQAFMHNGILTIEVEK
ncbi:DUF7127 family protein [Halorientalis litorea]|uniref:DUF7127 family protein n=1 Tax=Halorientalis litorea TaxID=2931977 RepID=UPI001FF61C11|nr:hypothetical protein [Halorientalis litorea]